MWLIKTGEPLPGDSNSGRLYRTGLLANELARRGHDVTWWGSTFDHVSKRHRSQGLSEQAVSSHLRVVQLHGRAYRRHISLSRLLNHREEARAFAREARTRASPDLIVCAYPTIDLSVEAVLYGRDRGVPVVLDVRDLWPDIFLDLAPPPLRPVARLVLGSLFQAKAYAFSNADAVAATSDGLVDWGVAAAGRRRSRHDRAFPHGYPQQAGSDSELDDARVTWLQRFGGRMPSNIACFFGNFSNHVLDLRTVVRAAGLLDAAGDSVVFVLCGTGPSWERVRESAAGLGNVILPGRVSMPEIRVLMENAALGLIPYQSRWDFRLTLPNKVGEFLSAGLPIVTCLGGELARLVAQCDCGFVYDWQSAEGLVRAIREITGSPETRARMQANAIEVFRDRFAAERVYADFAAHLEEICMRPPSGAEFR